MNRRILAGIFVLMLVTVACGSAVPTQQVDSVSTIVASTIQALTASAPVETQPLATNMTATQGAPTPNGKTVAFGNISFTIPDGLASSATDETTTEVELLTSIHRLATCHPITNMLFRVTSMNKAILHREFWFSMRASGVLGLNQGDDRLLTNFKRSATGHSKQHSSCVKFP